jgi:molybdopterin molybdotransferase
MISVIEAKKIIEENTVALQPVKLSLQQAAGKILAEDVYATTDIPAFPQSSMDGYAFLFSEWKLNKKLIVEGEIAAGNNEKISLAAGKAIRIFTGAPVPPGADTVIMQEKVQIDSSTGDSSAGSSSTGSEGELIIEDELIQQGANVRPKGSEIKAGEPALEKGSLLSPAAIGFLAGIGTLEVSIYTQPSISIIVTGNELQQPGKPLQFGQVYESNSFMLKAALQQLHITDVKIFWIDDELSHLTEKLTEVLQSSDMVLLTGGVSVGDYDFVLEAATACGIKKLFHKVKQRPGKPLYFGKKEKKIVFGLPGNPSSVLTCFYEYVIPALQLMTNRKNIIEVVYAPLAREYKKMCGLTFFLKGYYDGNSALPLDAQESYRLSSYAKANCLVRLEEDVQKYDECDVVEIHLLPK